MKKKIQFNKKARKSIMSGVKVLYDAVKVTLGAKGRYVLLDRDGLAWLTKDGDSVAKDIFLDDPIANKGAQLLKGVADKTKQKAGDGTTSSVVLAYFISKLGMKAVSRGINPMGIRSGIEKAVTMVVDYLKGISVPVNTQEEAVQVATISANGDKEIGENIAGALEKVGLDGVVSIQESDTLETTTEYREGMQFDRGYLSPYFCKSIKETERELNEPLILMTNIKIHTLQDIWKLLEKVANEKRDFLIIAKEIGDDALRGLIRNSSEGFPVCAVIAPTVGDLQLAMLEDMAILTGGTVIDQSSMDLDSVEIEHLGTSKSVLITDNSTSIIDGAGSEEDIKDRVELIKAIMEEETRDQEEIHLKVRLAKLTAGVAIVKVGGATEVEIKERYDRAKDSLAATRAALEEGIIPGGGTALTQISLKLEDFDIFELTNDERIGFYIVKQAIEEHLKQIVSNAGLNGKAIARGVKRAKTGTGYDVRNDRFADMIVSGIIDPAKVTRIALQNASSLACMLISTECAIVDSE